MDGYLSLYQCRHACHTFFLTWAEPSAGEPMRHATFVVTIIPKTQHGVIRHRVEGVDRLHAVRAEFRPMVTWVECYAGIVAYEANHPGHPDNRCWESRIRKAATTLVDVEIRIMSLDPAPYGI